MLNTFVPLSKLFLLYDFKVSFVSRRCLTRLGPCQLWLNLVASWQVFLLDRCRPFELKFFRYRHLSQLAFLQRWKHASFERASRRRSDHRIVIPRLIRQLLSSFARHRSPAPFGQDIRTSRTQIITALDNGHIWRVVRDPPGQFDPVAAASTQNRTYWWIFQRRYPIYVIMPFTHGNHLLGQTPVPGYHQIRLYFV